MDSLQQLFETHIIDLYNAERQLLRALPRLGAMAQDPFLKSEIGALTQQTEVHITRIKKIFEAGGFRPTGKLSFSIDGLMEETWELLEGCTPGPVMDVAIITSLQKCEHYEIRGYYIALAWAEVIGDVHAMGLISQTIEETTCIDSRLEAISKGVVRAAATAASPVRMNNCLSLEAQA